MSPIVEKLSPQITSLMKLLSSGTCDRRLLWGTVCVVLDGVQELLESPGGVVLGAAGVIGAPPTGTSFTLYQFITPRFLVEKTYLVARLMTVCIHALLEYIQCDTAS